MEHLWLTIIVPVYNAEGHIERCITSIRNQSFKEYELILIDDGSSDRSSEICAKYADLDKRIVFLKKDNGGPFQTRIYGFEHAHGEYITFCDADDYYASPKAFQTIYDNISSRDCDVLQYAHIVKYNHLTRKVRATETTLQIDRDRFIKEEYPLLLTSNNEKAHLTLNVWNKVYKRRLLNALPPANHTERLFWGDDLVFNLITLKDCRSITFISTPLYVYRDSTGGTNRFSKRELEDVNIIKRYQLLYLEDYEGTNKDYLRSLIHQETACWLGAWVKEGIKQLDEQELVSAINEMLMLPSIKQARDYYLYDNSLNWKAISLLREADPYEYIQWAKESLDSPRSFKQSLKDLYKRI